MLQQTNELQLCPLNTVMKRILERLSRKDPADIFAETVNVEEVQSLNVCFSAVLKRVVCVCVCV